LFYEFKLDDVIPKNHLLRRMNVFVTAALADLHQQLRPFYSEIGRPSVDPELMIRMLIVGHCYGIRHERRLCEKVRLHLAYRWFCKLDLDDKVPHHSTFSINRLDRFRESDHGDGGQSDLRGDDSASVHRLRQEPPEQDQYGIIGQRESAAYGW
jgi:transposase